MQAAPAAGETLLAKRTGRATELADSTDRLRVLFVGNHYAISANQLKLSAIADLPEVDLGVLTPETWVDREFGEEFHLERTDPRITYFPAKVLLTWRLGGHLYPPGVLRRAVREFRPDLLQVEFDPFFLAAFELACFARWTRLPMIEYAWESVDRPLSFIRRSTRAYVLRTTRHLMTAGTEAAALYRKWGFSGPITISPQIGVDTTRFSPAIRIQKARPFTVGFVGRLHHRKGVDVLFDAARVVLDRGHELRLIVCGSGPHETELRQYASDTRLSENVVWTGFVPHLEIPSVLAQLDAFVLPSRTVEGWKEQFGHVLIEAMAMGLPTVGSDSGEIPIVISQPNLIFPENDSRALANILEQLIQNPSLRECAGAEARRRAEAEYSNAAIARRYLEVWRTVTLC